MYNNHDNMVVVIRYNCRLNVGLIIVNSDFQGTDLVFANTKASHITRFSATTPKDS
jgi:hypothetical protein